MNNEIEVLPLAVIESPLKAKPYSGFLSGLSPARRYVEAQRMARNKTYARKCVSDSLKRGEAPYASHLFFDQPGILDDRAPFQRVQGMMAGFAWGAKADIVAVYCDLGISSGMRKGLEVAALRTPAPRITFRAFLGFNFSIDIGREYAESLDRQLKGLAP